MIFLLAGKVTNLVVINRSLVLSTSNHTRATNQYTVSPLDKCPLQMNSYKRTTTLVSLSRLYKEKQTYIDLRSSNLLRQSISDSQVCLNSSQQHLYSLS